MPTRRGWAATFAVGLMLSSMIPNARADDSPRPGEPFPLWPSGVPGLGPNSKGVGPTLTLYRPAAEKSTGAVVVVCPGGGYGGHADHEGRPIAEWLNGLGITAVVLKYRLAPDSHHPAMLDDAGRAIRTVRGQRRGLEDRPQAGRGARFLGRWAPGLDDRHPLRPGRPLGRRPGRPAQFPARPGDPDLSGDLAGHALHPPRIEAEPPGRRPGSRARGEPLRGASGHPGDAPDLPGPYRRGYRRPRPRNSLLFALALRKAKVPLELHVFEKGPHGLGLGRPGFAFSEWPQLCDKWLEGQGFLKK